MVDTSETLQRDPAPKADAVAVAAVHSFLRALARNLKAVETRATPAACAYIFDSLWSYLAGHIPHLAVALGDPRVHPSLRSAAPAIAGPLGVLLARLPRRRARAKPFANEMPASESAGVRVMRALARTGDDGLRALAGAIVDRHRDSVDKALSFLNARENAGEKAVIFLTVGFPTTWAPLAHALTRSGLSTYAICLYDYRSSLETGVLNTTEIPVGEARVLDFIGHLLVLSAGEGASILINSDSYYGVGWDAARGTVLYLLTGSMLAGARQAGTRRGLLVALKYDAVQPILVRDDAPVDRDPANMLLSDFYRFAMRQVDRVVYNANSEGMGAFNENAVPLAVSRLHFYRYASRPERTVAKVGWVSGEDIHLAILSSFLPDSEDHTRNHQADVVRSMLRQRIHVHYFCNTASPALDAYRRGLPAEAAAYFHPHAIIRDQQALVEEVQQYHLGLVLSDDFAFLKSIATLSDMFYREAESILWSTTMNSGAFVFAAAGLPFVCPRYMVGMQQVFGADIAMPMAPSEIGNLRRFIEGCDLARRMRVAQEGRHLTWMETNISRFVDFIGAEPPSGGNGGGSATRA